MGEGVALNGHSRLTSVGIDPERLVNEIDFWTTKESTLGDYDISFAEILRGRSLENLLARMQKPHFIVDLFSYGYATHNLANTTTISVALGESPLPRKDTHQHLTGDLEDPMTWYNLESKLREVNSGIRLATAILSRPLQGEVTTIKNLSSISRFVNRVYKLLDYDGFALLQVPQLHGNKYEEWIKALHARNVDVSYQAEDKQANLLSALFFRNRGEFEDLPPIR